MASNKNPLTKARENVGRKSHIENGLRSFLSNIFVEISYKIGLTDKGSDSLMLWDKLMNIYLNTLRQAHIETTGEEPERGKLNSAKGNIKRQLVNPSMTWRTFCMAMYFLRVTKIDFKITVHRRNTAEVIDIDRTLNFGKTAREVARNYEGHDDEQSSTDE